MDSFAADVALAGYQTRPDQTTPDQSRPRHASPFHPKPSQAKPKMNNREEAVKRKYEKKGWRMLRGGAPDFIAIKVGDNGDILEFKGIEVKRNGTGLSYEQGVYRKLFELAHIPFTVEVVE